MTGWITNSLAIATKLRKADADYEVAKSAASNLALADKVVALRNAKAAREAAYQAATQS